MQLQTESLRPAHNPAQAIILQGFDAPAAASPAAVTTPRTVERRSLERLACRSFRVTGAELDIKRVLFGLLPWMSLSSCDVESISKGGLAFESRFGLTPGETLEMQLWVPGEAEPITLRGEVRWSKRGRYGSGHRVGVQFAPFGSSASMNPREALNALRALESKHR